MRRRVVANPGIWRPLLAFLLSLTLYLVCLDPHASLWDSPEYILIAWGLEVGHPPGNPTWQLMANVVSHLGGSPQHAALLINLTSALAMAVAVTLLSEIIYILLRYAILRRGGPRTRSAASWCAVCGALCYGWCDSAIFSAVEAEVYALSAMVTALTVWLALRWAMARLSGRRSRATRIAILTWYVMGLSMGVHELNLLALPAMALIYWYAVRSGLARRRHGSGRGFRLSLRRTLSSTLWGVLFFLTGCSTYLILPVRATANPPVNQGAPASWSAFKAYYGREQYGSKPLLYGRTPYSQPLMREEVDDEGQYSYARRFLREKKDGKMEYVYPDELNMWLPRMTSGDDIESYEAWSGMSKENMVEVYPAYALDSLGNQVYRMDNATGERVKGEKSYRPTYLQQLRYMMGYQVGYMYLRYLMWNFSGRQNNVPSTGEIDHGNFITGIGPLDDLMLGAQTSLPSELKEDNRGYNRYFMIPFMLGVLGACWLMIFGRRGRRVLAIVGILFFFTGIGIVLYLNQDPGEPRERDYSFLGSFMAFAVWIGCAFGALWHWLGTGRRRPARALLGVAVAAVPLLMLSQTYDDHDRSGRDVAGAVGSNILNSLAPHAIIFVDGDNIVFPLWYAQEVLGVRPDVTVALTGYLPSEWYRSSLLIPKDGSAHLPVPSRGVAADSIFFKPSLTVGETVEGIISWNAAQETRRPVYWHSAVSGRPYFQWREKDADITLFAYKLREEGADSVRSRMAAFQEGVEGMKGLLTGGTENTRFYSEPYVTEELARMRKGLYRLSWHMRRQGDTVRADSVWGVAQRLWPYSVVPPMSGEPQPVKMRERRERDFRRYYEAMPASRRGAISRESLQLAKP